MDARCFSAHKLVPPAPLPYVSRRALRRVKDVMYPPKICHYCTGNVRLTNNSEVYNGRSFGEWPYVYLCVDCGAYVGLHPDTDLPTGMLANALTREARKAAKAPFMCLVRSQFGLDRNKAYEWLANKMEIPKVECHFAMFDEDRAYEALAICLDQLFEGDY